MRCVVLGNGPSLRRENIPFETDLIGVNRSYKVARSRIWVTVDSDAFRRAMRFFKPQRWIPERIYVRRTALEGYQFQVPKQVTVIDNFSGNSGLFGVYVAKELGYEEINLLGFDLWTVDHFEGKGHPGASWQREMTRMALWKQREDERLRMWNGQNYIPLAEAINWNERGRRA